MITGSFPRIKNSSASDSSSASTSAASAGPSASTSAASAGPSASTSAASAPVMNEQRVIDIIAENNIPAPEDVLFTYFTVGNTHVGYFPPNNLMSDQIVEYNLLQKPTEQRIEEHVFLLEQYKLLKGVHDSLETEYDKKRAPGGVSSFIFGYDAVKEYLKEEHKELHDRYKHYHKLVYDVDQNLRVYYLIDRGVKVGDYYKEKYFGPLPVPTGGKRHKRTKRVRKGLRRTRVNATERFRR